jgi:hypothetical protein
VSSEVTKKILNQDNQFVNVKVKENFGLRLTESIFNPIVGIRFGKTIQLEKHSFFVEIGQRFGFRRTRIPLYIGQLTELSVGIEI